MASKEPSSRNQFRFEPRIRITMENLSEALADIEEEIKKLGDDHDILRQRLEALRGKVDSVLQNQDKEIQNLRVEIQRLSNEVQSLKAEKEDVGKKLALAQVTWLWEAHLARFVADPSEKIYPGLWFRQMKDHLEEKNPRQNRWTLIKSKLARWTKYHWEVVNGVRNDRKDIAYPNLFDLDLVESVIEKEMSKKCQERMKDMLKILKTIASLMKFGRLVTMFPPAELIHFGENALNVITSWDREFEDINGLLNIKHDEAKKYVEEWVNDREIKTQCVKIVDFIKQVNSKRLGKLAWEIEKRLPWLSMEHGEALNELKNLLLNPDNEHVKILDATVAKLHIPDFLLKPLWKDGIKIVEEYLKVIYPVKNNN